MRLLSFFNVAVLVAVFLSGYFIMEDIGAEKKYESLAQEESNIDLVSKYPVKPEIGVTKPENGASIALAPKSQNQYYNNTPSTSTYQAAETLEPPYKENISSLSAGDLLASIVALDTQHKTLEEIRDGQEFQQLVSLLSTDPTARSLVLEQFMKVSGTPMGQTLSQALASSGNVSEIPQIKAAATKLLRDGSVEQRINALQLLGQSSNDQSTRSLVLDILRNDSHESPQLAIAAMSTLNRQGAASQTAQKEVTEAVSPLIHNSDPQVRQNSLQLLSQWAVNDKNALQTFTEATNDTDSGVRSLAISALGQGGFTYDSVRAPLLSVLQNPHEDQSVKAAALQALESFPLDEQALKIYQAQLSNYDYQQPGI